MSIHLHRNDQTGLWSCGGPYPSVSDAVKDAEKIMATRKEKANEVWRKATPREGYVNAWVNHLGDTIEVKVEQ